jgi:hypothetical protein
VFVPTQSRNFIDKSCKCYENAETLDTMGTILRSENYFHDKIKNGTPWHESASELYRPSDRRLSEKLVPTFANRGVSRSQHGGSSTPVFSVF